MTQRLVVLYNNYADQATLSGGSWLAELPLTNMQNSDVQRVARSADTQLSSTVIRADLGFVRDIDGIAFGPVNLTPGATWIASFFDDPNYSYSIHDTGLQTVFGDLIDWTDENEWFEWEDPRFWYGIVNEQDALPLYAYHVCETTVQAQYVEIEIMDSANADGFIDIGRLMITQAFRPSVNYDEQNELSVEPLTDVVEALGGRRSYFERGARRKASYALPNLQETEVLGDVFSIALRSGISRQVFVVPDADDTVTGSRRSFLATMRQAPAIRQLLVARGSTQFDFDEVL